MFTIGIETDWDQFETITIKFVSRSTKVWLPFLGGGGVKVSPRTALLLSKTKVFKMRSSAFLYLPFIEENYQTNFGLCSVFSCIEKFWRFIEKQALFYSVDLFKGAAKNSFTWYYNSIFIDFLKKYNYIQICFLITLTETFVQ